MENASLEAIRQNLVDAIPFARHLRLEVREVSPGAAIVALGSDQRFQNHIGTVHAGAIFTLGETGSGAAAATLLSADHTRTRMVATGARIEYLRIARGDLVARAAISLSADSLHLQLSEDGRVEFAVNVDILDAAQQLIARMQVEWLISRRKQPPTSEDSAAHQLGPS